jgi:single-stranded DNA-binding protein
MTIIALVTGSLFKAPERRTSKSGKPFAVATIKVRDGDAMQFVRIVMFSESAQTELLRLSEGDSLSAQGSLKAELYAKDGGEPKLSLSIVADQILALKQPPKEREAKPKTPAPDPRLRQERCAGQWAPGSGPDDNIPFGNAR